MNRIRRTTIHEKYFRNNDNITKFTSNKFTDTAALIFTRILIISVIISAKNAENEEMKKNFGDKKFSHGLFQIRKISVR